MTDDTTAQPPKPPTKRQKTYRVHTHLSDKAGDALDKLANRAGLSRTAYLETTLIQLARKEGLIE